jgi:hypothetical protein
VSRLSILPRSLLVGLAVAAATALAAPAAHAVPDPLPVTSPAVGATAGAAPSTAAPAAPGKLFPAPLVPPDPRRLERALHDPAAQPEVPTTPGIAGSHDTRPVPWWLIGLIGLVVLVLGAIPPALGRLRRSAPVGAAT